MMFTLDAAFKVKWIRCTLALSPFLLVSVAQYFLLDALESSAMSRFDAATTDVEVAVRLAESCGAGVRRLRGYGD